MSETYALALSAFDPKDASRAVLEFMCSDDPFPDLGKLISKTEAIRRRRVGGTPQKGMSEGSMQRVAKALGIDIGEKPTPEYSVAPERQGQ